MPLSATPSILLLRVAAAHTAPHATSEDADRILRLTDKGVVLGTVFLVGALFMLWVLWSFWRDSRRDRTPRANKFSRT